ncbi:Complex III assembly protein translocase and chaperone [Ceratocystis pirilliformis]|uniref:Complex III assembly protein translocase and chaperone n=1 Tax=Ceratocystis pirilliformis TaxID=259994 RepID=A0ABR3YVL3_9PEZI
MASLPPNAPSPGSPSSFLQLDHLLDNPVFAGGAGLAGIGAIAAFGRRGIVSGAHALRRRLLVNVEISRQDPAYPWVLAWLGQPRAETTGFISSRITRIHNLSVATSLERTPTGGAGAAHFYLQPGYGRHIIQAHGAYIAVNRERHSTANMNTGEPHETVLLTTLWSSRGVFESVFAEAHSLAVKASEGKTRVFAARGVDWVPLGEPRRKRPLKSVILDENVAESISSDIRDFLSRQQWYTDRGIPYRRGYLLYGPPGSGKSSFIQALAGELDYDIALVNLGEIGMTNDKLAYLMTKMPPRSLLLLEDADVAFANRMATDSDGYSGTTVTFSGLLNALDGLAAKDERIAFLTTNFIQHLDDALIRPGRVDQMAYIGNATQYQAKTIWERFYGDVDTDGTGKERFLSKLESLDLFSKDTTRQTSMAAIQGLFLLHKDNFEGVIEAADSLVPKKFGSDTTRPSVGSM